LQGELVPASEKDPEGWTAADKFTVVLESAGFNATELSAYCRERGLFPEQVDRSPIRVTGPPELHHSKGRYPTAISLLLLGYQWGSDKASNKASNAEKGNLMISNF
jgi:hypothetical protein